MTVEVGGAGTLPRSIAATRVAGTIALIGVLSGTYSTVFIAAPLLLWLMKTAPTTTPAAKQATPEKK